MKELVRSQDQFGTVAVYDDGNKRYLSFGELDQQSCILKADPAQPQYAFVRMMLLALLYIDPKRILSFGLGAGSLNSALVNACPQATQKVVELRPRVVEYAYRYFYLPRNQQLEIDVNDAADYVKGEVEQNYDLIFSDLYSAQGLCDTQVDKAFLQGCIKRLRPRGWLVLNCWREHRATEVLSILDSEFSYLLSATTQEGNWLLFATNDLPEQSQSSRKQRARELSVKLGYSLMNYAKRLKRIESCVQS